MPEIEESLGSRRSHLAALRRLLRAIASIVTEGIITTYAAERVRMSDADESWFTTFARRVVQLTFTTDEMVNRILRLEGKAHTDKWSKSVRRTFGIDISSIVREEDLDDVLRTIVARNSSLIKSLSDDAVKRVEQATYQAFTQGQTVKQLQSRLKEEFGMLDRRAELIARDQMSKANADFNRVRHQQAGIDEYDWSTSKDERVRKRHVKLEGKRYKYGQTTGAEGGLAPGVPVRCRCTARAVVRF